MDDQDLYESLPPTSTSVDHMVAGAAAGILEHSVMYPVDCVKVWISCLLVFIYRMMIIFRNVQMFHLFHIYVSRTL